jgi:rod shape determining protein RodA
LAFADFLSKRKGALDTFWQLVPCFLFMGLPCILIIKQNDLGTAMVYMVVCLVMMYFAGANARILTGLVIGSATLIALLLFLHFKFDMPMPFLQEYQLKRLTVFVDPRNDGRGGVVRDGTLSSR